MKIIITCLLLIAALGADRFVAAQPAKKVPRVGLLIASSSAVNAARVPPFRDGLRDLGYVEGKNIILEQRYADGKVDRLPGLAAELVAANVDVIVTGGPLDTRAAKKATHKIPIVMTFDNDPVGNGFVTSLAQPGGNITGLSTLAPELSGKQLELLQEIVPKLSRVAVFGNSTNPGNALALRAIELAADALKIKLRTLNILSTADLDAAFRAAVKGRDEAIQVLGSPLINIQRARIAELSVKHNLPGMYYTAEIVEAGGLMSYGVNRSDLTRRAAVYVDKILKGAKPADLPVEQPMKFDFVINLKTAKQIGLTIPPNVLVRADRVIR